jgi:hypothetical protein
MEASRQSTVNLVEEIFKYGLRNTQMVSGLMDVSISHRRKSNLKSEMRKDRSMYFWKGERGRRTRRRRRGGGGAGDLERRKGEVLLGIEEKEAWDERELEGGEKEG